MTLALGLLQLSLELASHGACRGSVSLLTELNVARLAPLFLLTRVAVSIAFGLPHRKAQFSKCNFSSSLPQSSF